MTDGATGGIELDIYSHLPLQGSWSVHAALLGRSEAADRAGGAIPAFVPSRHETDHDVGRLRVRAPG